MARANSEATKEIARILRASGETFRAIAVQLDVSHNTVVRWCNPDYAEHCRRKHREWRREHLQQDRARQREWRNTRNYYERNAPYYRFLKQLRDG